MGYGTIVCTTRDYPSSIIVRPSKTIGGNSSNGVKEEKEKKNYKID